MTRRVEKLSCFLLFLSLRPINCACPCALGLHNPQTSEVGTAFDERPQEKHLPFARLVIMLLSSVAFLFLCDERWQKEPQARWRNACRLSSCFSPTALLLVLAGRVIAAQCSRHCPQCGRHRIPAESVARSSSWIQLAARLLPRGPVQSDGTIAPIGCSFDQGWASAECGQPHALSSPRLIRVCCRADQ